MDHPSTQETKIIQSTKPQDSSVLPLPAPVIEHKPLEPEKVYIVDETGIKIL